MNDTLLIVPAFNEEGNIKTVIEGLKEYADYFDYIIINDGSTDKTMNICIDNNYNVINLPVNLGLAGAFLTGLKYAVKNNYSYVVQFDADGQHRPEYISDMKEEIEKGYDIVIGSRIDQKLSFLKSIGSFMIKGAIYLTTGKYIIDPTSGMRMYNKNIVNQFIKNDNYAPEPDTIAYLIKRGAKVSEIKVKIDERIEGSSYLTPIKIIKYMYVRLVSILIIQNFRRK